MNSDMEVSSVKVTRMMGSQYDPESVAIVRIAMLRSNRYARPLVGRPDIDNARHECEPFFSRVALTASWLPA
jgi:hypothetical protein